MFARSSASRLRLPSSLLALAGLGLVLAAPVASLAQNIESPIRVIEGLEPVSFAYGDHTVDAAIDVVGDVDEYRFFGEAGDVVQMNLDGQGSQEMWLQLVAPDGAIVVTNWVTVGGASFQTLATLPARGTYGLFLQELHSDEVGPYVVQLERRPSPGALARPDLHRLYYGAARFADELSPSTDSDSFVFEALAGTAVQIFLRSQGSQEGFVEIYDADGVRLVQNWCTTNGCDLGTRFDVSESGTYEVVVFDRSFDETGPYDISLECISGDCPPITEAVYQIVEAGPNCVNVRLINNVPVRGGELSIGYDSSVVSLTDADIVAGPDMPAAIAGADIDAVVDLALGSCPADPEIDRGLIINWLDRDGGDVVLLPGRHEILTICFDPAAGTDNETCPAFKFLDCLGPAVQPVENIVTDSAGDTHLAETIDSRRCLSIDTPFRRGDANGDGRFDVSDAIAILICQFLGRGCSNCPIASDANDDERIDTSDAIYLLNWRFHQGAAPPAPFPACGFDPTPDVAADLCIEPSCS